MEVIKLILLGVVGYLLGSANTSLIVGKFYGVDVRQHGSGNAGMTNTLRTLGKVAAILVIVGDILKGVLSCLIGLYLAGPLGLMIGGLGAVVGHNWPVYFGFKGGKGVLTSLSVALMMDWQLALVILGIFVIIVAITRYVSLGSIIASVLFPVLVSIFREDSSLLMFTAILAILIIYRHNPNIKRLLPFHASYPGSLDLRPPA